MTPASAFPASAQPAWLRWQGLLPAALDLRHATESDLPFLRALYAGSRAQELARVPWPEAAKRAFCDSQFELQHCHYAAHCRPAAFLVVMRDGCDVGRLTLHWTGDDLRIVDLLVDAAAQGQGMGTSLLRWIQATATGGGFASVSLQVSVLNDRAHGLYGRLGFVEDPPIDDGHRRMSWRPRVAVVS
jgi:ribosomal protein S18 acetylase RimI-like enzyme